eukprot:1195358-Prorocentrum_minimum.AAC.5
MSPIHKDYFKFGFTSAAVCTCVCVCEKDATPRCNASREFSSNLCTFIPTVLRRQNGQDTLTRLGLNNW